jgi:methionyl-tRNA formyltransferase
MKLKIVFMGTPEFAAASLKGIVEAGENVVGVITVPDKPKGRGKKIGISPVKEYAQEVGLKILQPTNLKSEEFLKELKSLKANLQVVVAFRMLPEVVWTLPKHGTFNLHGSLLPQYRGAAPINWAVINGEKETGVTTFFLKHQIDTGNIILQEKEKILPTDNVGDVYARLMHRGAKLVLKTVRAIAEGTVETKAQLSSRELKPAPKIFKEDCEIDWTQSAERINNFVRGLSPYPAAWTVLHGTTAKIFRTEITGVSKQKPGEFIRVDNSLIVGTDTADLKICEIQLQGKKRMATEDFLRGYHWPTV